MKIIRSSKCSIKFATNRKKMELNAILTEYGKVVNLFIDHFWNSTEKVDKSKLLKPIVDLPKDSWLSARLRKVAAREALDMISSVKEVFEWNKQQVQNTINTLENKIKHTIPNNKENRKRLNNWHKRLKANKAKLSMIQPHKPIHKGERMVVSCTIAELQTSKLAEGFDSWLHLASIGNKITLDIPIKFHKQFNELSQSGKRLNSYIITKNYVQFCFEIETGNKKEVKTIIGVDTGINALASLSTGEQLGKNIKEKIDKIKRCEYGSKGKHKAMSDLKQTIDKVAKDVVGKCDLIVMENLSDLNQNSKLKGRLSKNIRSSIGSWNYSYWINRVEMNSQTNRVSFRTVQPYYTSQRCPICSHTDSKNRVGEIFKCQKCGHTGNADVNAALNIKERFLTGKYGSCYKPENKDNLARCKIVQV